VEQATMDRIQRMIDDETGERFPRDAVSRLVLLHYGDHPVIEPGELYLRVVLQDGAARHSWMEEYGNRLEDFRAQRLPEVMGFMVTTDAPDGAGRRPTGVMKLDGISLLDTDEDELARGFVPVRAHLGPVDLATLDTLITAGIAASRAEGARWALARVREQPSSAGEQPSSTGEQPSSAGEPQARADQERAGLDPLISRLQEQVKERYPHGGVQRAALLQYGDDPWLEPGDRLVRVWIEEAEEDPPLPAWERDHEAMISELHREVAELLPGPSYLEFYFGQNGRQGRMMRRLGGPSGSERDLTAVFIRLGPMDLEMVDTLITTGIAASRAEAIGWALARIRERPAYARLSERARELEELKARF
jgi:uncharacterized protein (DUF697 family)